MEKFNSFFSDKNTIADITDKDIAQTENYLEVVRTFAKLTYQSVYIIDYYQRNFEYVSDNPLFLCGLSSKQVQELGYDFYFQHVGEQDLNLLLKINQVGFDFFDNLPVKERKDYTISYDFHIINEKKNSILINHKLTPLFLNEEGKIWKAMCIVSLSPNDASGNITISKVNSTSIAEFNLGNNRWETTEKVKLSEREIQILILYARGLTINEIADKIFISPDTVKFHRRKLFEKMDVSNITEALSYAKNKKLI
ncbi:LuxR family transcriptional regulator [Chryseobacterium sp. Leaf180]|uniref:response regulator transcription factor n=1 Tax=Chryseobacterium sp. Leaf180 TaxID=1736289 RepID=UPI0006FD41E2|nr:helix-turn-helix transcriptional regulator [Chryseobacterium sp. Leaf180]KQR95317.1 LuxR family transcriptional regulator [Chryseobacterium sp. Leaf180]